MSSIGFALKHRCLVRRRATSPSKDVLNAPDYGVPISWPIVYEDLPCRLEISRSDIQFKPTGERIAPLNLLYVGSDTPLLPEDRVFMDNNDTVGTGYSQEFIVQGAVPALTMTGQPGHHSEYSLLVP